MVYLGKYNHTNPFLNVVMILSDHRVYVSVSKEKVLYICNILRKAARVVQISQSGIIGEEDSVEDL